LTKYFYFIAIILLSCISVIPVYASNTVEIESVSEISSDSTFTISVINTSESPLNAVFKVGASVDESSYKYGLILNTDDQKYASYSGSWSSALPVTLGPSESITLQAKLSEGLPEEFFYLRVRYKNTDTDKIYNTDYPSKILLSKNDSSGNTGEEESASEDSLDEQSESGELDSDSADDSNTSNTPEETKEQSEDLPYDNFSNTPLNKEEKENVFITEFFPSPAKGNSEWVEIYNNNDFLITIKDWFIDDTLNSGGTPVKFSAEINAKKYFVIKIDKALLNNSGDTVTLLDESKNPIFSVLYTKSKSQHSIQKLSNNKWYITSTTTPAKQNLIYEDSNLSKPNPTTEESTDTEHKSVSGEVLGESTVSDIESTIANTPMDFQPYIKNIPYRKIPYYKQEKPFTFEKTGGKVYVLTEKSSPSYFKIVGAYLSKAFW
jgi:hypothetical protein